MDLLKRIEESILFFEDIDYDITDDFPSCLRDFQRGEYMNILVSKECEEIFCQVLSSSLDEPLEELLEKGAQQFLETQGSDSKKALLLLCVGAAALGAWLQHAECGPPLSGAASCIPWLEILRNDGGDGEDGEEAWGEAAVALARPSLGDADGDVPLPLVLLLARATLRTCASCGALQTGAWWWARTLFAHQRALGEPCPVLHTELTSLLARPPSLPLSASEASARGAGGKRALLHLEAARAHLWYGHLPLARAALDAAREAAGLAVQLIGAMGKRTRYQQKELAQLTLQVQVAENNEEPAPRIIGDCLPKDVHLQDDVRLDRPVLTGVSEIPTLSPAQQAVVLSCFAFVQRAQPHDELAIEELEPYLQVVLADPQLWSIQASALLLRSRLEGKKRRTAERAMCQLEELCVAAGSAAPGAAPRLRCLLAVPGASLAGVRSELAHALARLGCVQSALDLFLELRLWEEAVACYTALDLRYQAAELLRRELSKKETVPLLCLLGDATSDPIHYERAWVLSGERSARAQRHWAMHHFARKQYGESIPHLRLSLEYNSLQPELWRRLGYAALDIEDWSQCAAAYRRCVELDPENVEAWNNLAKAYTKTGSKPRAWAALQEALKIDYENWRLWDNAAAIATDVGAFEDAIRACHRLLDLRPPMPRTGPGGDGGGGAADVTVLRALVHAVSSDIRDGEGMGAARLRPKALALFGRITATVTGDPEIWRLYATLTASLTEQTPQTLERTAQYLQRAHRAATQRRGWTSQRESAAQTLHLTTQLAQAYLTCAKVNPEPQKLLNSAKLSIKSVLAAVRQEVELASELNTALEGLDQKLSEVEEAINRAQEGT